MRVEGPGGCTLLELGVSRQAGALQVGAMQKAQPSGRAGDGSGTGETAGLVWLEKKGELAQKCPRAPLC